MSTAEIIAELRRLTIEELARMRAEMDALAASSVPRPSAESLATHPALGVWKDRTDLPADAAEASMMLRERLMHRTNPTSQRKAAPRFKIATR